MKGDKKSDVSNEIYFIKEKKFKLTIYISNNPDQAKELLKKIDLVFLCFRTDNNDTFLNLTEWITVFPNYHIGAYNLIANCFKSPYYSINEIQDDCQYLNEIYNSKFYTMNFNDFSNVETVRILFESIVLSCKFDFKKKDCNTPTQGNCNIF